MRKPFAALAAVLLTVLGLSLVASPTQAIVGGTAVPSGAYPFMASVRNGGSHLCGGSVIADTWVLTAAHCVSTGDGAGLSVRVGSNNNASGGTVIDVDLAKRHPDFDGSWHDVALLRLASAVPANVAKITLSNAPANDNLENNGTAVVVAGWGDFNPLTMGLLASSTLNEATLNVVDDNNCNGDTTSIASVTAVCAAAFLRDSCQGDSGGPLFWKGSGGQRIQIGVVSHGLLCAIPQFPGYYSEVNNASIRSFISTNAGV